MSTLDAHIEPVHVSTMDEHNRTDMYIQKVWS